MKPKYYIPLLAILLIAIIFISGCVQKQTTTPSGTNTTVSKEVPTGEPKTEIKDYTFIQTTIYKDGNSTTTIIKNKLSKTASIEMTLFYDISDLRTEFGDFVNFTTTIGCGLISIAFFNKTALEEFNKQIQEWNSQEFTVKDDSPPEQKEEKPLENPLEGYKVNKVQLYLKDKATKNKISECRITGASESDIIIKIY